MGMGIDGLVSGLDTTSIINALIAAEAGPQTLMKTKVTTDTALQTAMQALNTKFAALTTQAAGIAATGGLDFYQASSSSSAVTVSVSSSARNTALDLTVDKLAASHSVVSAPLTEAPGTTMSFVRPDGTSTEVTAAGTSLDDMAYAINKSDAGISAVKVAAGTDANGAAVYRLQLTSTDTGAAHQFTAVFGSKAEYDAGTAPALLAAPGAATLRTGQDAQVTLWAGTAAATSITSASNSFAELAPGVNVTVNQVTTDPATVTVTRDAAKVTSTAKDLVSNVNIVIGSIFTQAAVTTTGTGAAAAVTGGLFTADSTTGAAKNALFNAVTAPIDGNSPATIGINSTKNGDFSFDADAFAAAYAKDPAGVEKTLQTIADRVATAAKSVSDPIDGTLSQRINGQQTVIDDLNSQIVDWDSRLATRRASLQAVYTNLEVQLGKMQSQQSWLTSQISSFDAGSSQKK
ncbi:flagellar filament capping protein FliD [Arthrobacter dokdonensis]|uniref:flagellar filament capping protein FliD n=1 Tax=Arthrobacter dokdonellae TaxID=2211210 RepID=UPI000DE5AC29|nr:flagellar filament capping protein FliD [Arthrobacter dokdonellae]